MFVCVTLWCVLVYVFLNLTREFLLQPRPVAGFRGTVRYASVNAHKNKVNPGLLRSYTPLLLTLLLFSHSSSRTLMLCLYPFPSLPHSLIFSLTLSVFSLPLLLLSHCLILFSSSSFSRSHSPLHILSLSRACTFSHLAHPLFLSHCPPGSRSRSLSHTLVFVLFLFSPVFGGC